MDDLRDSRIEDAQDAGAAPPMTTPWTPGPWTLDEGSINATLSNGEKVQVTGMFPTHFTGQSLTQEARHFMSQEKANARLIAAAPELLAAGKALVAFVKAAGIAGTTEHPCAVFERMITKAEGRG